MIGNEAEITTTMPISNIRVDFDLKLTASKSLSFATLSEYIYDFLAG